MNKKIKTLITSVVVAVMLPIMALGLPGKSTKIYRGNVAVTQPDEEEIEYFTGHGGKTVYNAPRVIRTLTPSGNLKTARYDINLISNTNDIGKEHKIIAKGAYLTVNNVIKEDIRQYTRLLFVKGPVTLNFSGKYLPNKTITKYDRYLVENGKVIYNIDYDVRTSKNYDKEVFNQNTQENLTTTISEPGMYSLFYGEEPKTGIYIYIYVVGENEDIDYTAPTKQIALPKMIKAKVNNKVYTAPSYIIGGENYLRLRDIAYMVNSTEKQFNVYYNDVLDIFLMDTFRTSALYNPIGGELKGIPANKKNAIPSKHNYTLDGSEINPSVYTIDGIDYLRLSDIADINDMGLTWDSKSNMAIINTEVSYNRKSNNNDNKNTGIVYGQIKSENKERFSGDNRYETAVAISKNGWEQSDNVVIANGENHQDALVGASFAHLKNAPILINPKDKLEINIKKEIERLCVKNVYIIGNDISTNVEDELKGVYNVERISGADYSNTAFKIGEEIKKEKEVDTIILASENSFTDALSIAPYSAKKSIPILFTSKNDISSDADIALNNWGIKNVIIVGGAGVITEEIENHIKEYGVAITRLSGTDRYDTALEVMKYFIPEDGYKNISIASGESYPDALTGAVLAAKKDTPLVLVSKNRVKSNMEEYLKQYTIDKAYLFGGVGVLNDRLVTNS